MAASCPISRAGLPSRKPIEFSASMPGAGRRSRPAVCSPAKPAARSWPSISPKCASRCRWQAQPSSVRAMARVKAVARHPVRCTTLPLKLRRPMPANAHLPPLADRLALSFIGRAARRTPPRRPYSQHHPLSNQRAMAFTPMTPRPFHDRRATTDAGNHLRSMNTIETQDPRPIKQNHLPFLLRLLLHSHRRSQIPPPPGSSQPRSNQPRSNQPRSTKAFSRSPNPDGAGTSRTCALWRPNPVSSADVIPLTRITCALRNRAP